MSYVSALYAVIVYPSVCLSVCHKSELYSGPNFVSIRWKKEA